MISATIMLGTYTQSPTIIFNISSKVLAKECISVWSTPYAQPSFNDLSKLCLNSWRSVMMASVGEYSLQYYGYYGVRLLGFIQFVIVMRLQKQVKCMLVKLSLLFCLRNEHW